MGKGGRRPDRASEAGEGPSRPASPDTARPEQSEGQPQKIILIFRSFLTKKSDQQKKRTPYNESQVAIF